jgi:hypothetical protein
MTCTTARRTSATTASPPAGSIARWKALGFFPGLERLITAVTGQRPRVDDLKLEPEPAAAAPTP